MSNTNMVMAARWTSPKQKVAKLLSELESIVAEEEDLVKQLAECRETRVNIKQRLEEAYNEVAKKAIHKIEHGIPASSEEVDFDASDDSIFD
jgi:ElaB/YqjD/DUF883 family membrane-anchored ribosome-binding protein